MSRNYRTSSASMSITRFLLALLIVLAFGMIFGYAANAALGDLDNDGDVDEIDVRLCYQIAQGYLTPTAAQRAAADVDGDGDIDETDARMIAEYTIGLRGTFPAVREWTFMVYICGDNNLESAAIDDINEMEAAGSTNDVNIVAIVDRIPGYDTTNGNWTGTRYYYITRDTNGYDGTIVSTMVQDLGEKNLGNPNVLIAFAKWVNDNYPAQHYALVLWNHGSGVLGDSPPEPKVHCCGEPGPAPPLIPGPLGGVAFDDTSGGDGLTTPETRTALQAITTHYGGKLDIVGYDACLMGMAEHAYELEPYAAYMVGSEESEPNDGWDYQPSMTYLTGNPTATAAALASRIVTDYGTFYGAGSRTTLSAVDLSTIRSPSLKTDLDALAINLISRWGDATLRADVQTARVVTEAMAPNYDDYVDLYDFCVQLRATVGAADAAYPLAQAVKDEITTAVISNWNDPVWHPNCHGLSIYFPCSPTAWGYSPGYSTDAQMSVDTSWDNFLQLYCESYP